MRCTPTILVSMCLSMPAVAGTLDAPILGGTPASVGQFPSVVLIETGGGLCTGTLIAKDWVLTAAHCISPAVLQAPSQQAVTQSVRVHFKTVNPDAFPGTIVTASNTIPNPSFSLNTLGRSDIGLIKLSTPVTDIVPTPVNFVAAKAPIGIAVTMVGFGRTLAGGGGSVGVEYVVSQVSVSCSTTGAGSDADLLCFNQVSGKGKCEGDSGGPSFAMIDGKQTQIGVTSFGDQNCAAYGADTRTDAERAFVTANVPELECNVDSDCPAPKQCFQQKCIAMPFGPSGLGSTCAAGTDCDSGVCGMVDDAMKCSAACTVGMAETCPDGFDCLGTSGSGACWPSEGGGCCDAGGGGASTFGLGIGVFALLWRRRRR